MRHSRIAGACALVVAAGACTHSQVPLADLSGTPVGDMPEGWRLRGTNGLASALAVEEVDGGRCAVLRYNFEAEHHRGGWLGGAGRKTCIVDCWTAIPEGLWLLEVDLEGDGSGHGLIISVGEPDAEWFNYDLGRLDFAERKTLTVDLRTSWRDSAGPRANKLIEPPLALASVNLEQEPGAPLKGEVRLFGVRAIAGEPTGLAALSLSWSLPEGAAFTVEEDVAPHVSLENLGAEDLSGKLTWVARCQGETVTEGASTFTAEAGEPAVRRLTLGNVPIGFYDVELRAEMDGERRTFRSSFAVLPAPQPDPRLRVGAGESYPWFTASEGFIDYTARLARMGASWTLAFIAFTAFDGPGGSDEAARQCEIIDQAAENDISLVCMLGNLPADLVDQQTNRAVCPLEDMVSRFEAATAMAAEALPGQVSHWGLLHLDRSFFPEQLAQPLPSPDYAQYVARSRDALAEADPDAGFIAGLVDDSFFQWPQRGDLTWPEGVGFISERLFYAHQGELGSVHEVASELVGQQREGELGDDLWLKGWYARVPLRSWDPGRQFAEGVAMWLVEAVHAAPNAHVLYTVQPEHPERGGLIDHADNINLAGVSFAILADLLRDAEPDGEFAIDAVRGYLFTCDRGTSAALWPQPIDGQATLKLEAAGTVEHYGAIRRYADVPEGTAELTLRPGINLLRGDLHLSAE